MTSADSVTTRRTVRRELHSPRSVATVAVLIVAALVVAWIAVESVLVLVGAAPLLATPRTLAESVAAADTAPLWLLAGVGAVAALLGVLLLALALRPGRRGRRSRHSDRAAVVIDDAVIAGALSGAVARTAGLTRAQVRVSVGRRDVAIDVTPTSGLSLDRDELTATAKSELTRYALEPALAVRLKISETGSVGA